MSKLKIKLEVFNSTLVYCVLEQCESITRTDKERPLKIFVSSNGVKIVSSHYPYILRNEMHLRGCHSTFDSGVSKWVYTSHEEALEAKKKVLVALQEFADQGYFGRTDESGSNVYEF